METSTSATHTVAKPNEYLPAGDVTIERELTTAERDPECKGRQVAVRYADGRLVPVFSMDELTAIVPDFHTPDHETLPRWHPERAACATCSPD